MLTFLTVRFFLWCPCLFELVGVRFFLRASDCSAVMCAHRQSFGLCKCEQCSDNFYCQHSIFFVVIERDLKVQPKGLSKLKVYA